MKSLKWSLPLATAMLLMAGAGAHAQPQGKLTTGLGKSLTQAMWCSALLLEESYMYDEGSDDAARYEDMAFDLGAEIDLLLTDVQGMRQVEVDEIWALFDDEAYMLAGENEDRFLAELAGCETNYDSLL